MRKTANVSIWWVGRDLRLADNPALTAAVSRGSVVPVSVIDAATLALGAAERWRLAASLASLERQLVALGAGLVVRFGEAYDVLTAIAAQTHADEVHLNSGFPHFRVAPDVVDRLAASGSPLVVHPGNWLKAPGSVLSGKGTPFRVYTPFWKSLRQMQVSAPLPAPAAIRCPSLPESAPQWPQNLGDGMDRGAAIVARYARIGEGAALARLEAFLDEQVDNYKQDRDRPDLPSASSNLSDALSMGEISARQIWHATWQAGLGIGAEHFLSEVVWREFARDLLWHAPDLARAEWRDAWRNFAWRGESGAAEAWRRAQTGEPIIDAAMRELYATGRVHNRMRMVAASYLTKHLRTDWRVGLAWFADTLIDHDPASNALGWQWVAGSGPDASPYFRVFNPRLQADKFDPEGKYRHYWLEGQGAQDFAAAIPRSWGPPTRPPEPIVGLAEGRAQALEAYQAWKDLAATAT